MEILDYDLAEESAPTLSSIGKRIGALLIDGLVLSVVTVPFTLMVMFGTLNYFFIPTSLIALFYKPVMEFRYGATLGKLAVGIRVVDLNGGNITLKQSFIRSIFHILSSLSSMISMTLIVSSGLSFDGILEYSEVVKQQGYYKFSQTFSMLAIADYIPAFFDKQKQCVHDRIAKTIVILK